METNPIEPLLVSVKRAAEFLNVKPCTIRALIRAGSLAYVSFGKRKFCVDYADLKRYVAHRERQNPRKSRDKSWGKRR
jgi:excisionase family DNA binding protein